MVLLAAALAFEAQKERPLFPKMVAIDTPRASASDRNERKPRERSERPDRNERSERSDRSDRSQRPDRAPKPPRDKGPTVDGEGNEVAMVTYRIEVGRNDDVSPKNIVGAIANEAEIDAQFIGHIKLHDDYSTVDLPEGMPKELFDHLYKVRVCQKPLKISVDNGTAGEQRDAKPAYKGKRDKPAFNKEKPAFKGKPKAHRGSDSAPRKPSKRPVSDRK